jgi:CRISP-associated protein Cas1
LIRLKWDGLFASIVTTGGQAASSDKVYWQERTRNDPTARLRFARDVIRYKALSTLATMGDHVLRSAVWDNAYENIAARSRLLEKRSPRSIEELLGLEGSIANEYFRAWSSIELKWKALKQRPIPDDWRTYKSRSALRDESRGNHRATRPVNAMLNYAYGVLIARTQVQLILQLVASTTFAGGDFSIQPDGVCRLNPQLARRVAQLAIEQCGATDSCPLVPTEAVQDRTV